jgi:hypothetical protein
MREVRVPVGLPGARGLLSTGLFVATVVAVAVLVPRLPHQTKTPYVPYTAVNGTVGMNWFFQHPIAKPATSASTYGIESPPIAAGADAILSVKDSVRPSGAPGGSVCLILLAVTGESTTPAQTAQKCAALRAGWSQLPAVTLRTAAPSLVYAEITARGNDGGFEARLLAVTRGPQ